MNGEGRGPGKPAPSELGRRTVSGGVISAFAQGVQFLLHFASIAVLARLLSPSDFGMVVMVTSITGFMTFLLDGGLSTATVQRDDISDAQITNLFWINGSLGLALTLVGIAIAPAVAWFYKEPRLVEVMMVLSITFTLAGLTVQHDALLLRRMRFAARSAIQCTAFLVAVVVAIALATTDFGYWSLVGMNLALSATTLVLTWAVSTWRPSRPRRAQGTLPIIKFGANLTVAVLLHRAAGSMDTILLGRIFGPAVVGVYTRASALILRPMEQLLSPFSAVMLPALSRLQSEPRRYRETFLKAYEGVLIVCVSFSAMLLGLSDPIVRVVLGPGWDDVVVPFAVMTLVGAHVCLAYPANWLLTSQGRGREVLRTSAFLSGMVLIAILFGAPFGAVGVAVSLAASALCLRLPLLFYVAGRSGPVRTKDLWTGFLRHVPRWAVIVTVTFATMRLVADWTPVAKLALGTPVAIIAILLSVLITTRSRELAFEFATFLRDNFGQAMIARLRRPPSE